MTNMNVEKFKNSNLGFGFNNGLLNLNNNCIKSSQFCKLLN